MKGVHLTTRDEITIEEMSFPKPFVNGLEFNAPVHGSWNIVHIGLQMPEAVQIYVCAKNCMRGVILTAAEMGASNRFSFVILEEKDMVSECIDDATLYGVIDVIEKRQRAGMATKAVQLFTVCTHHFLGTDYKRLYQKLEQHFPDIDFYQCFMDPIMQKKGLTPDQKLRRSMYQHFENKKVNPRKIALLGSDFPLDRDSELYRIITENGFEFAETTSCQTYEEFRAMEEAAVFIATYPNAKAGVESLAKRLKRDFLYLPASFEDAVIEEEIAELVTLLKMWKSKWTDEALLPIEVDASYEKEMQNLKENLGDCPLVIDGTLHPKPLGLAKLCLMNGLKVDKIYADLFSPEEELSYQWLLSNSRTLTISQTIHVRKRLGAYRQKEEATEKKVLALGQKAAYFEDTPHFVNMVAGFGLWGYEGRRKMLLLMKEAFLEEKDTKDLVPRKGLGCESCLF